MEAQKGGDAGAVRGDMGDELQGSLRLQRVLRAGKGVEAVHTVSIGGRTLGEVTIRHGHRKGQEDADVQEGDGVEQVCVAQGYGLAKLDSESGHCCCPSAHRGRCTERLVEVAAQLRVEL